MVTVRALRKGSGSDPKVKTQNLFINALTPANIYLSFQEPRQKQCLSGFPDKTIKLIGSDIKLEEAILLEATIFNEF